MQTDIKTILTHSETFHCDEVTAVAMLQTIKPELVVTRTRNRAIIEAAIHDPSIIVIDVGHIYDPTLQCYDHHQPEFHDTFSDKHDIPLSSCGLIYRHYGKLFIDAILQHHFPENSALDYDYVYNKFYDIFILPIDANDNGVECGKSLKYAPISLSSTVAALNKFSNDVELDFKSAVLLCSQHLEIHLKSLIKNSLRYNEEVKIFHSGVSETPDDLRKAGVLLLSETINVRPLLRTFDKDQHYKFIIVPRDRHTWNIWTISAPHKQFETVLPILPEAKMREKYGDKLVFIHKTGFCGVTNDRETAIAVALDTLQAARKERNLNIFGWICGASIVASLVLAYRLGGWGSF